MAILKIKDDAGNVVEIPAIKGKSAYEYARDGGYTGTEEEFAAKLAEELPFGEKSVEVEIFRDNLTDFEYDSDMQIYTIPSVITVNMLIEEGKTYDVVWDGVEYTGLIPHDVSAILGIGGNMDTSAATPEEAFDFSTYPFIIATMDYDGVFVGTILTNSTESTHNVEVSTTETKLIKLPDKYQNQVNWNETDETKASCLLNRPFGEYETGEIATLVEHTLEWFYTMTDANCYNQEFDTNVTLREGGKYQVIIDGVTYDNLVCFKADSNSGDALFIGATPERFLVGRGEYPFIVGNVVGTTDFALYVYNEESEPTTVTLTVNEYVIAIKQIDAKYIPDGVGGSGLPEVTEEDNGKVLTVVDGSWSTSTPVTYEDGNEVTY